MNSWERWEFRLLAKRLVLELAPHQSRRKALEICEVLMNEVRNDPILFPEEHDDGLEGSEPGA